ncbi:uncharacterized protein mtg isoform X2 [Atheta coriaria]|uniref:uncharacterized protein mtg isoform X2 n=1 Tax=Dalotia coriaria TaxID=877792 RepID=UPI0031F388E5
MKCASVLLFLFMIGFSLGDELGFKESISNTEINRRRSAQGSKFTAQAVLAQQQQQVQQQANSIAVRSANVNGYDTINTSASVKKPSGSSTVPPFKPIPPAAEHPAITKPNITRYTSNIPQPAIVGMTVPEYPVRKTTVNAIKALPTVQTPPQNINMNINRKSDRIATGGAYPYISNEIGGGANAGLPVINMNALQTILAQANISESTFEAALRQKVAPVTTTTTTTTTTTPRSTRHNIVNIGKVMNAPKEYYPVGYDKNFDDNFASRVELPETSFYCGDQKHFPGLYADEDLGCMVFHVCALTDDGLIMKSFLCPESTLFDQTILKCNWWFYVDCKNSKKLYDSNIPISKSYQLMKALTFFSAYKKDAAAEGRKEKD